MKAFKIAKKSPANVNVNGEDECEDGSISENHRAYKDANKDTDINVDISNIDDEISHQQHNYDKVSTITSTPIKCQRRNHHQIKATNSSSSSSSHSHSPTSFSLTTTTTKTTATMTFTALLSSPSIGNYETCQWSAILRHYVRDNLSIHQHQYHHKPKHTLHHHQHATSRVLNINKCNNSSDTTPNATGRGTGTSIYESVDQYVNATWNHSYTLSCLLLTLFIAFTIGIRSTTAGACWQTVLDNGKCNEIFSLNISKSECCGANQEFAYTEREPTNVEYFFATAIGGGMECSPCLESCRNVKCGPNKKCVKRKGRPKCICAPECGAARRKRKQREHLMQQEQQPHQQHHTLHLINSHAKDDNDDVDDGGYFPAIRSSNDFKIKIEKSQQSRDTRSLSSEITNVNLGLANGKDAMISSGATSSMERHHCKEHNQNQRKLIHMHHSHGHGQQHHTQPQQPQQVQQPNYKNQEPNGSRRLLITANVEHTEKPTTRRLQIFSNVRTTHARRHNKPGQHEDTDPSDYFEENDEDYNYNDAEDDAKEAKNKNNYSRNIDNGNNNNKNNDHGSNKNNRNDESTRFLNQSPSRHKLKTNTKSNNNSRNRNTNNKNKNKNHHDLQTTKIQQHSSKNNNTRVRHSQQNGRHAENTLHHGHHNHNHHSHHQHQQQHQPHHRQQQRQQEQQHNHNQQHQSPNHGRHKHNNNTNKQHHKQQSIVLKKPKNNKDYNSTTTNTTITSSTTTNILFVNTTTKDNNASNSETDATAADASSSSPLHQSRIVKTATTPTSLNLSSLSAAATTTSNTDPQHTQSQLLLPSSATSSFASTTPVNSTMSADDGAAADDHYHSRLPNRGSKIATSSLLSATSSLSSSSSLPSSSSHSQLSGVAARSSSESAVVTMSAKGEGVLPHDHKHRIEIPMKTTFNHNNNNNNNDNQISALQSNLHNNQKQQQDQQHYQTPLFDGMSEQFDLIGFTNKQRQQILTNEDNVKPLNPVCGTDGRTYNTECQLRKRACRTDNSNLQIAYRGHCRTTCNGVKCLNGLTCVEDQYSMPHCITCKIECPQDDYDNDAVDATKAVCGADGKTYKSTCDINRMICKIGRSIGVAYPGPCREDQVTCDDINCGSKQVCLIDLLTHKPRCTSCRYKCSRKRRPSSPHYEEGKICGVNNRTYNSWCEMRKDSCSTGFYIDIKYSGDCH
ncbi:GATA zinc finger domain-containing protein 14 [Calliphora vicina]|uniref:GATA zinc finger domain-containing protein 14 n=1 Tax=Calliphora vicina TaxID=7373 RepID=UPI00325BCA08